MFKVGVVEVLMSLDSSAFTGTGVFWTYVDDPVIIKIQPSIVSPTGPQGDVHLGQTPEILGPSSSLQVWFESYCGFCYK